MELYHYYDVKDGPFRSLSELPEEEAQAVLKKIRRERPKAQAAARLDSYIQTRRGYEEKARELFLAQGGRADRATYHSMVVEPCPWLASWYENPAYIKIPLEEFDLKTLSFTYGDLHPTLSPRVTDGKEYRKKVYLYEGICALIQKYGLPQDWNADGRFGPERYIECQVWSDETIGKYLK